MICASEDVSNADPNALVVATSAALAVERLGMPEARIVLAQAATYVACAPKSNSAICAIDEALEVIRQRKPDAIPAYLQDAHYKGAKNLGRGIGYQYSHEFKNHYSGQTYLPEALKEKKFYHCSEQGYEKVQKQWLKKLREEQENG